MFISQKFTDNASLIEKNILDWLNKKEEELQSENKKLKSFCIVPLAINTNHPPYERIVFIHIENL